MKKSESLQRLFQTAALLVTLNCASNASAFTYTDTDLLLVCRKTNSADVLFNLGTISNYLGQANGTTITISNFDFSLVTSNFANNLSGVEYVLIATTGTENPSLRVWISDAAATGVPTDETLSKWGTQRSKINAVGSRATAYPDAGTQAVINSDANSYSGITAPEPSTLGSTSPYPVEQDIGGVVRLFELKATSANPKPPATQVGRFRLLANGVLNFTAGLEVDIVVTNRAYSPFSVDLTASTYVYVDADPAAGSPVRATQRCLGYREVDYKSMVPGTLAFSSVAPSTNGSVINYDYSAQAAKINQVGFWVDKDVPMIVGPDGNAYITDGHHTTAGYLSPISPVRNFVPGLNRVIMGHIVANYFNPLAGPLPVDDSWWTARASENNALLYGPDGNLLILSGEPNFSNLQPILPSVLAMPTTPSTLTTNGAVAMTPSKYRGLTWALADAIVVSATDSANKKIVGYKKSPPGGSADINFVEFYWADYLRNRVDWDDTLTGSPYGSPNGDASVTKAPLSFFAATANGIALAKSEAYRDQFGRSIYDYTNSATFTSNTVFWAGASISNGLAAAGNTFNLYLRDDSTIIGTISPSALSANILRIDTVAGLSVTQTLQNIGTVIINAGSTLATSWKDSTVSNSVLRFPAGTGIVTVPGTGFAAGKTILGGGALAVEGTVTGNIQATNGLLQGNGTINGAVTVSGSGVLSPGASIGILTINGALSLAGNTVMEVSKSGPDITNDTVVGISTLTYGGVLTVTASGSALSEGDAIKLFNAASYRGAFASLVLPPLPGMLAWDSSRLLVDGTLVVGHAAGAALTIAAQPTNQIADVGTSVTLVGGAVGTEPITYQWNFNGSDLTGQTNSTLSFASVAEANQGTYFFVAANSVGSVTSSPAALLTVNQGPVSQSQSLTMSWNNTLGITLGGTDADGDTLTFAVLTQPAHGALTGSAPNLTYQPAQGYVGPDSFTYRVNDGRLNSSNATISITVRQDFTYKDPELLLVFHKTNASDVIFNLGSVSNYIGLAYGTPRSVTNWDFTRVQAAYGSDLSQVKYLLIATTSATDPLLRAWLTDADETSAPHDETLSKWSLQRGKINALGTGLSAYSFPDATNQSVTINPANQNSYTYIATDGHANADIGTMNGASPYPIEQDIGSDLRLFELKATGANPKPYAVELGRFSLTTNGALSFVAEFNRAPLASTDGAAGQQDQQVTISVSQLLGNDSDADGNTLSLVSVSATSTNGGSVTLNGASITYTPLPGFKGLDAFTYVVSDNHGGTATGTVQIFVTDTPIPPQNNVSIQSNPGGGYLIRFSGTPGQTYELRRAAAAEGPYNTTIATMVAPVYGVIDFIDPSPLPDQAFYQTVTSSP